MGKSARLLLALLAGALVGWLFLPMPLWMCGAFRSDAAPAWVQAIGSILAILVAAGIPAWQEWRKDSDEGKRLSIATSRLRSNIEALGAAAGDRAAQVRTHRQTLLAGSLDELIRGIELLEIVPVEERIDQIHDLDPRITTPIIRLLEEYDQYQLLHARLRGASRSNVYDEFSALQSSLIGRLERIGSLAFDASNAIRLIDEEHKYPDIRERNQKARREAARKKKLQPGQAGPITGAKPE